MPPSSQLSTPPDPQPVAAGPDWLQLRSRFAAFGVVGAMAVALPMLQVLRYQHAELQEMSAQRALLDPVGHTLALQRGLIGHRDVAARVLGGDAAQEPERRLRQAEVDQRLVALTETLEAGPWEPARREGAGLREDWSGLLDRLTAHRIDATASGDAHRLLVEQALQIIDLVGEGGPAAANATGTAGAPQAPGWPQHARLALRLARSDGAAAQAELHVLQASTVRAAATLDRRIAQARAERAGTVAACLALLLAAALCGWRLWRSLRALPGAPRRAHGMSLDADAAWTPARTTAHEHDASDLIERLRRGDEQRADAQPERTLPPQG